MKVVLFCGGLGSRLREHAGEIPKPLVTIGDRPILWHLMKYYAHFGHREFILCLGYGADLIREYFAVDAEAEWSVRLVDSGVYATVGERLKAVAPYLKDEEIFLANYGDGLSDLPLDPYIEEFRTSDAIGTLLCVRPSQTFHVVDVDTHGVASAIREVRDADVWINGGFFAVPTRDLRLPARRRGPRRAGAPAADRGGLAAGAPLRGFLGGNGHPQGQGRVRRDGSEPNGAVDGMGAVTMPDA